MAAAVVPLKELSGEVWPLVDRQVFWGMGHLCGDHPHGPSCSGVGSKQHHPCTTWCFAQAGWKPQLLSTVKSHPCDPVTQGSCLPLMIVRLSRRGRRHKPHGPQAWSVLHCTVQLPMFIEQLQSIVLLESTVSNTLSMNRVLRVKMHALISQLILAGQPGISAPSKRELRRTGKLQPSSAWEPCFLEARNWA